MGILIRRGAAWLAGLLVIMTGIWSATGSAWAGGPTSVLIVNPSTGAAAALHTSDGRYQRLVAAVGAYDPPSGPTDSPAGVSKDCSDCQIRLTWMIHDMTVWRVDRVYLTGGDGIWLQSVSDENGGGSLLEQPAHWQQASDPDALLALLRERGLLPTATDADNGSAGTEQAAAPNGETRSAPRGLVVLGSGIVGVAIGLVGGELIRRRRPAPDRAVLAG